MDQKNKCVLKRIHKGAYECAGFLIQRIAWTNEKWDGPRDSYRGWKVYRRGSFIEKRVLVETLQTRRHAYDYVQRQMSSDE